MAPPVDLLRVATYNVHACVGTDRRHDPERVASVVSELDADVVALQEFTYPASVAIDPRTPVVLTTLDSYECALGPTRQRKGSTVTECFGNALLTRPSSRAGAPTPRETCPRACGTADGSGTPSRRARPR